MKTKPIKYRAPRVRSLIQKYDAMWCPASGEYRTNLDDMERFRAGNYRRIDRESLRKRRWKRPVKLTPSQKLMLEREEIAKLNATRKKHGMAPLSSPNHTIGHTEK